MDVTTVRLKSWNEIHGYAQQGWVYRGQSSEAWPLITSLERRVKRFNVPLEKRADLEQRLIREFKRAYHQYSSRIPPR